MKLMTGPFTVASLDEMKSQRKSRKLKQKEPLVEKESGAQQKGGVPSEVISDKEKSIERLSSEKKRKQVAEEEDLELLVKGSSRFDCYIRSFKH